MILDHGNAARLEAFNPVFKANMSPMSTKLMSGDSRSKEDASSEVGLLLSDLWGC